MSEFIEQFLIKSNFVCIPTTNVWIHRYKDDVYNLAGRKKVGLSLSVSNCGYLGANINIYDKPRWVPLHLLRAIAFVPFGEYEKVIGEWETIHDIAKRGITVNHKDGNKLNNDDDNLEWTTHKENMIHAHKAGLQPNTKAIYVYDIFKREEMYFYSIAQAELHYGWGESAAGRYLKTDRDTLFAFRYLIRKNDEPDYVVHLTRHDAWKTLHGTNGITPVAIVDKRTNERKLYPMRSVAIRSLHLPEIFKRKWNSSDDYIANEKYLATPVTDIMELEQLARDYKKVSKQGGKTIGGGNKALQVRVIDSHGNTTIYNTLKDAAKQLNVPRTTLVVAIHRKNWRGGTIEYIKE